MRPFCLAVTEHLSGDAASNSSFRQESGLSNRTSCYDRQVAMGVCGLGRLLGTKNVPHFLTIGYLRPIVPRVNFVHGW